MLRINCGYFREHYFFLMTQALSVLFREGNEFLDVTLQVI